MIIAAAVALLGLAGVSGQTNYQQLMVLGTPRLPGVGGFTPLVWANPAVLFGTTAAGSVTSALFSVRSDGSEQRVLHDVTAGDNTVSAGLVLGPNGTIFGMNSDHLFKMDAGGYLDLFETVPQGVIALGYSVARSPDGTLFGTAAGGGTSPKGVVFRLNPDGSGFQVLHAFAGAPSDGDAPVCGVILGADGVLYGNTKWGGTNTAGTVFRINTDGSGYKVLHDFSESDGLWPQTALLQGSDGKLYGTTWFGGGKGVVFKLSTDGSGFAAIYNFAQTVYASALIQGPDHALYGTTQYGGLTNAISTNGMGTVFKLNTDGSGYTVLHEFSGEDGRQPKASLLAGSDGALYGTTAYGGYFDQGTLFKLSASATASGAFIDYYPTPAGLSITLSAAPAQTWSLQWSANLGKASSWQTQATVQTDPFGLAQFTHLSGKGFYRAVKQ